MDNLGYVKRVLFLYKKDASLSKKSRVDFFIPFVILFVFFIIISILLTQNNFKEIDKNWPQNRCNPRYMFFAGYIHDSNMSPLLYTFYNFMDCLQGAFVGLKSEFKVLDISQLKSLGFIKEIFKLLGPFSVFLEKLFNVVFKVFEKFKDILTSTEDALTLAYSQIVTLYTVIYIYLDQLYVIVEGFKAYFLNIFRLTYHQTFEALYKKNKKSIKDIADSEREIDCLNCMIDTGVYKSSSSNWQCRNECGMSYYPDSAGMKKSEAKDKLNLEQKKKRAAITDLNSDVSLFNTINIFRQRVNKIYCDDETIDNCQGGPHWEDIHNKTIRTLKDYKGKI